MRVPFSLGRVLFLFSVLGTDFYLRSVLKTRQKIFKGQGWGGEGCLINSFLLAAEKIVEAIKINLRDVSSALALANSPPVRGSSEILRKMSMD